MVINYAVNLITHQFSISGSSLILKQRNWNMAGTSLIVALFPLEWLQQRTGVKGKEQRRPHSHSPSHARHSLCLHSLSMQRRKKPCYLSIKDVLLPSLSLFTSGRPEMACEISYQFGVMRFRFSPDTQKRLLITFNPLFTELVPASSFKSLWQTLAYK